MRCLVEGVACLFFHPSCDQTSCLLEVTETVIFQMVSVCRATRNGRRLDCNHGRRESKGCDNGQFEAECCVRPTLSNRYLPKQERFRIHRGRSQALEPIEASFREKGTHLLQHPITPTLPDSGRLFIIRLRFCRYRPKLEGRSRPHCDKCTS